MKWRTKIAARLWGGVEAGRQQSCIGLSNKFEMRTYRQEA